MMKRLTLVIILILPNAYAKNPKAPKSSPKIITTHWVNDAQNYQSKAKYFKEKPLFHSFDKSFFNSHQLPLDAITYRNKPTQHVTGSHLTTLIDSGLEEIRKNKKQLTHFIILKELEFDRSSCSGCMVLKFKEHPFILKLFIESPYSFHRPKDKGFRHGQMSYISGGMNRYLSGFGRIKNLEETHHAFANNPQLSTIVDLPRKWFWQPNNNRWFELHGSGFEVQEVSVQLPEVYGIITDEIVSSAPLHYVRKHFGKQIFNFCKSLKFNIDPNMKNFRLEQSTNKLVLIDTEHFPTLLGLSQELQVDNYFSLHLFIGYKVIRDHLKSS